MDRVWLREYEKILSSNRRCIDVRPLSADISHNRVKKGRPARSKKNNDNFISEADVAKEILEVGTDLDEYNRQNPEKQERLMFRRKLERQINRSKHYEVPITFNKLLSFSKYNEAESRRVECFLTENSELFHEMYPNIDRQLPLKKRISRQRPQSSPLVRRTSHSVKPFQMTHVAEAEMSSRPERPHAQFDKHLADQAIGMWQKSLRVLRFKGKEISYQDLSKLSRRWKKSEFLHHSTVYISILLGLKIDDIDTTQRSLFRELYTLLKFFREVNPLTLPNRRLVKANYYYENNIFSEKGSNIQWNTKKFANFEINILGWIEALQAIFGIILVAKNRHDIVNANFDESLGKIEAEYVDYDPNSGTPFKHLRRKEGETKKQKQHRYARLSPTGDWSTRLSPPLQKNITEEKSMGEGLSAFDSATIQSLLDTSNSGNIPLEDLSLEYSPDHSHIQATTTPLRIDSDPYMDYTTRCTNGNITSPTA